VVESRINDQLKYVQQSTQPLFNTLYQERLLYSLKAIAITFRTLQPALLPQLSSSINFGRMHCFFHKRPLSLVNFALIDTHRLMARS